MHINTTTTTTLSGDHSCTYVDRETSVCGVTVPTEPIRWSSPAVKYHTWSCILNIPRWDSTLKYSRAAPAMRRCSRL